MGRIYFVFNITDLSAVTTPICNRYGLVYVKCHTHSGGSWLETHQRQTANRSVLCRRHGIDRFSWGSYKQSWIQSLAGQGQWDSMNVTKTKWMAVGSGPTTENGQLM